MNVQEIGALHRRYIDVSDRFKSSWTFHQFLQGLHKLLMDGELGQYAADFQAVYGMLKEVSQHLDASTADRGRNGLDMVERRLQELDRWLVQEDSKLSPSLLRLFFQRVRNYSDAILVQLIKFYLFSYPPEVWGRDQNDKVDFLVTKVSEEAQGPQGPWTLNNRAQMRQIFNGLWQLVRNGEVDRQQVETHRSQIEALRRELNQIEDFDQLIGGELVKRYRRYKLELGKLFFHPDLLLSVVETNLDLRNHIRTLYRKEERRIVADYQRIFDLEREVVVDGELDVELAAFRQEVEQFERSLQNQSLSLDELGKLREHVRNLVPRLTGIQEDDASLPAEEREAPAREARFQGGPLLRSGWVEELLHGHYRQLTSALEGVDPEASPKVAAFAPDLFEFRLEPREIVAFRRLARADEAADREREDFLLWAAALRARTNEEIEEIRGILDDTAVTREAPVFARARLTTRLADLFIRRFGHEIQEAMLGAEVAEARDLKVLQMRLVRESAGLWLLVHKP
ncbi:MAG TPA: hypothetical protein VMT16_06630 [Thermoanaerobaculia bacterium]|nr:hypothetical protein [Thermoanaerobaculia bacterium]